LPCLVHHGLPRAAAFPLWQETYRHDAAALWRAIEVEPAYYL
jgi:hypothetical protein